MVRTIAIDGPAASGKTVVGRELARLLGFWFLDTGIMYRAVTWLALERGVSPEDATSLGDLAHDVQVQPISMQGDSVAVAGRQVGPELRESRVDGNVSDVSKHSVVRHAMVLQQRAYADTVLGTALKGNNGVGLGNTNGGIVMIGRDIGTVVLPSADLKVFLTAAALERARRRCREMQERGQIADVESVRKEIETRDSIDSSRDNSPLRPANDAWQLDTSDLEIGEVVSAILCRVASQ